MRACYSGVVCLSVCVVRPVILEVPHFASLRGVEREITVLRSDNGHTWREHTEIASERSVHDLLRSSFEGEGDYMSWSGLVPPDFSKHDCRFPYLLTVDIYLHVLSRDYSPVLSACLINCTLNVPHPCRWNVIFIVPASVADKMKRGCQCCCVGGNTVLWITGSVSGRPRKTWLSPGVTCEKKISKKTMSVTVFVVIVCVRVCVCVCLSVSVCAIRSCRIVLA